MNVTLGFALTPHACNIAGMTTDGKKCVVVDVNLTGNHAPDAQKCLVAAQSLFEGEAEGAVILAPAVSGERSRGVKNEDRGRFAHFLAGYLCGQGVPVRLETPLQARMNLGGRDHEEPAITAAVSAGARIARLKLQEAYPDEPTPPEAPPSPAVDGSSDSAPAHP